MTRAMLVLAVVAILAACDTGPREGDLVFSLTAPNAQDGAVAFTITAIDAETVAGIAAECAGCQVLTRRVSDAVMQGVVTGPLGPGPLLRVTVSNRKEPERYTASIHQVAARDHTVRAIAGYALVLDD